MDEVTFAGRWLELKKLSDIFEKVENGKFSIAMITGESGSGKTALAHAFVAKLKEQEKPFIFSVGFSNPHSGQGEPYLPFRHALTNLFDSAEQVKQVQVEPEEQKSVAATVTKGIFKTIIKCAPDLVEHFVPGGKIITKIGEKAAEEFGFNKKAEIDHTSRQELQAGKIYEQYTHVLKALSAEQSVVMILDDMQWCDTASANLLFHLARSLDKDRVMLICIYRNAAVMLGRGGEKHPLESVLSEIKRIFGNVWIDLDQVSPEERSALVNALVDAEPNRLGKSFRDALLRHTDGHALFASELLKCLKINNDITQDQDGKWVETADLDWKKNPEKMEGVIESRLGLLEDDLKNILSIASVQGFQFILQVITRLQQSNERESLQGWGKDLSKKHLLIAEGKTIRVGGGMLSFFRFSSTIFQQYLYNRMGESERMMLHGDVAQILEEIYKGKESEVLFELARHYDLALMPEKAIPFLYQAGRQALLLGAYIEARMQLQRASELISELPENDDAKKLEADIWLYLSQAVRAIEGWNSPAAKELYEKVQECCEQTEEKDKLLEVLFGLWAMELVNADLDEALQTAQSMQEPAISLNDPVSEIRANISLGNVLFWMGDLEQSREASLKIRELRKIVDGKEYLLRTGYELTAIANQFESWTLFLQGAEAEAKVVCQEAIKIADSIKHSLSQAIAYTTAAFLYQFSQQAEQVLDYSEKLVAISEKNGFESYRGLGLICRQWALVQLGKSESVAEIEEGYALWRQYSGRLTGTFTNLVLADCLRKTGHPEEALDECQKGIDFADSTGEKVLKGLLLIQQAAIISEGKTQ